MALTLLQMTCVASSAFSTWRAMPRRLHSATRLFFSVVSAPLNREKQNENLTLTNVILAFLIIVLSIQTKIGIKVSILFDRAVELWEGQSSDNKQAATKKNVRFSQPVSSSHMISQADYLDNSHVQPNMYPPAPIATTKQNSIMETYENMMGGGNSQPAQSYGGPMAANSLLGGAFGSAF